MQKKRQTPEGIIAKLRQVDVVVAQGTPVADAIRSIGVTEVGSETNGWMGRSPAPCRRPGSWSSADDGVTIRSGRMRLWATNLQPRRWLCQPYPLGRRFCQGWRQP